MEKRLWFGDHAELDAKVGEDDFNEYGIHSCCSQFDSGNPCRHGPVESLDLGPPSKAILECDVGVDLSAIYPSFVQKSKAQIRVILQDSSYGFFDPTPLT